MLVRPIEYLKTLPRPNVDRSVFPGWGPRLP